MSNTEVEVESKQAATRRLRDNRGRSRGICESSCCRALKVATRSKEQDNETKETSKEAEEGEARRKCKTIDVSTVYGVLCLGLVFGSWDGRKGRAAAGNKYARVRGAGRRENYRILRMEAERRRQRRQRLCICRNKTGKKRRGEKKESRMTS